MIRINGFFNTFSYHQPKISFSAAKNNLENSPETDIVELSKPEIKSVKAGKTKLKKDETTDFQKKLAKIKDEKILTEEVLYFLEPKIDLQGKASFTKSQTGVIDAAYNKIKFFEDFSNELSREAERYADEVFSVFKEIFGGDEEYGKHLVLRKKDKTSVYNKLVKEFRNERIRTEVHNIFAKKLYGRRYSALSADEKELVKICIMDGDVKLEPKDYKIIEAAFKSNIKESYARKLFSKPYNALNNIQKNKIKEAVYDREECEIGLNNKQARAEAYNYVRDLIGIRLILPEGSRAVMSKVERYIDKAIKSGKMNITRVSNYHSNHILPYISQQKVWEWKEAVPGMELVESADIKKKNGYTTTQINVEHYIEGREKPIMIEFQIRTEELNYIGQVEHLIYDILENKDISKKIPELQTYYDSIGIKKAVEEVFNNPDKEAKYTDYERAYYSYIRNKESEKKYKLDKPLLEDYGLGEYEGLLSFDSLKHIDEKAKEIKERYGTSKKAEPSVKANARNPKPKRIRS